MTQHPEQIEQLVERSSFGAPAARRARAQVSDATARALLRRMETGQLPAATTGTYRSGSARSTRSGQFRRPRGMDSS